MAVMEREGAEVARAAIARVNREPEFVRETMQVVWEQLLAGARPKIATYSGKGPLHGWLRVVATRVALDRCRNQRVRTARHVELMEHLLADLPDPELQFIRTRYVAVFQVALHKAVAALSLKERNLLRLHVEERCSIDRIGQMHGVHRATAARWLDRIRAHVFDEVRAQLALDAAMTESEFRSVARAIESELTLGVMGDAGASRSAQELRSYG
jgi:RNA polymerase sigma-70 factor (ECF subfamily)